MGRNFYDYSGFSKFLVLLQQNVGEMVAYLLTIGSFWITPLASFWVKILASRIETLLIWLIFATNLSVSHILKS